MSQTTLAKVAGLTYQQVQKYERGTDRVAAGTLRKFADALNTHPGWFFDDLPAPVGRTRDLRELMNAASILQRIRHPILRDKLLAVAEALAQVDAAPS